MANTRKRFNVLNKQKRTVEQLTNAFWSNYSNITGFDLSEQLALFLSPSNAENDNSFIKDEGSNAINATAYSGKALSFDGTNDFVDTGKSLTFDRTDTFEFEGWVYFNSTTNGVILSQRDNSLSNKGFYIYTFSEKLTFSLHYTASNRLIIFTDEKVLIDKWQHIKITYNGNGLASGVEFYINGVLKNKDNPAQNNLENNSIQTSKNVLFGKQDIVGSELFFDGKISNPKITVNGQVVRDYKNLKGIGDSNIWFDAGSDKAHATVNGATVETGLSGLENGETHNGIPQSANEEWNSYSFIEQSNNVDLSILPNDTLNDVSVPYTINGWFIISDLPASNARIFDYQNGSPDYQGWNIRLVESGGNIYFDVNILNNSGGGDRIGVRSDELIKRCTLYNFTINYDGSLLHTGLTVEVNGNTGFTYITTGTLTSPLNISAVPTIGTNGFFGLVGKIEIVGFHKWEAYNEYVDSIGSINGVPASPLSKLMSVEDLSNLGFDIFGNAIQHSIKDSLGNQILWNFDGESWIDTNWNPEATKSSPFSILFNFKRLKVNSDIIVLITNRERNSPNRSGIESYIFNNKLSLGYLEDNGTLLYKRIEYNNPLSQETNFITLLTRGSEEIDSYGIYVNNLTNFTTTRNDDLLDRNIFSTNSMHIGRYVGSPEYFFEGQLSQIQFFEKDLYSKASEKYQELFDILNA